MGPDGIRTLIADDEPLAREGLKARLAREPDINIVGETKDGPETVAAIRSLQPDLVLLDIQMPGMNGFDVLGALGDDPMPIVVFVTAFDQFALRAFDAHAEDYLLKPFTATRLQEALSRVRREIARAETLAAHDRFAGLLDTYRSEVTRAGVTGAPATDTPESPPTGPHSWTARFTVKDSERFLIIPVESVDWIEAAGNYAVLHTSGGAYKIRDTMTHLAKALNPLHFARIHRSAIVQISKVKEIRPEWHGDFDVELITGTIVRMSRHYRERLLT